MTILVLTDHGTYLGREKEQFKITYGMSDKPTSYIPSIKVKGILVDAHITISSGAFKLLRDYGIPVIWHRYRDDGMILQPFASHGSVDVRRAQYAALDDIRGIVLASKFVFASCQNKLTILRKIQRRDKYDLVAIDNSISAISTKIDEFISEDTEYERLDIDLRQKLMNVEAVVAKSYYSALSSYLNKLGWSFENRSRRPARDPFNALLNYSYAVLEGQITQSISISGLDMYAGFLHTDRSGRKSLVLDCIEEFRQIVDELLIDLIRSESMQESDFEITGDTVELTSEIKDVLLNAFFRRMEDQIQGQKVRKWLINQGRSITAFLRGIDKDYYPFIRKVKD